MTVGGGQLVIDLQRFHGCPWQGIRWFVNEIASAGGNAVRMSRHPMGVARERQPLLFPLRPSVSVGQFLHFPACRQMTLVLLPAAGDSVAAFNTLTSTHVPRDKRPPVSPAPEDAVSLKSCGPSSR